MSVIAAGVVLYLLQNRLYFGPDLFFRELFRAIGNRAIGIPSKNSLKEFYQSVAVVHLDS